MIYSCVLSPMREDMVLTLCFYLSVMLIARLSRSLFKLLVVELNLRLWMDSFVLCACVVADCVPFCMSMFIFKYGLGILPAFRVFLLAVHLHFSCLHKSFRLIHLYPDLSTSVSYLKTTRKHQ